MPTRMVSSAMASSRVTNCAIKTKRKTLIALVIMSFLQGGSLYYSRHSANRGVSALRQNADVEPETAFFSLLCHNFARTICHYVYELVKSTGLLLFFRFN